VYRILQTTPFRPDRETHGGTVVLVKHLAPFLALQKGCAVTILEPYCAAVARAATVFLRDELST